MSSDLAAMDKKKQDSIAKENRKMKNTFSVPVKKPDTSTPEMKKESKAGHKSTCSENRAHMATTVSADTLKQTVKKKKTKNDNNKENRERIKPTGKKTQQQAKQKNLLGGDKLQSTEQHDESSCISNESDSISRTIAEVIGRTEQKNENATEDSKSLFENDVKRKNIIVSDDLESLYENDIDDWDWETTDTCEKSSKDTHFGKKQSSNVKSKKSSQDESEAGIPESPKTPQLTDHVSSDLSPGSEGPSSIYVAQEETGTWVQCSSKKCNKWRYLADVEDPVLIPEFWECSMNSDTNYNSCDIPQMEYQEAEHIYTKYTIGTVVWAKLEGYPWWPAMIECDPDTDMYYEVSPQAHMVPLQYHVSFFDDDDHVSRSWVRARCITPYRGELPKSKLSDGHSAYKKEIAVAMKNADKALLLRLKDRVETYGFQKRFLSKRVTKIRSLKKVKSPKLGVSAGHIFLKSESVDYTRGIHKSPPLKGSGPLKKITKRRPLETKIMTDQTGQSQVHTSRDTQSNSGPDSNTPGATIPDKLSKTVSSGGNNNMRASGKHRNSDEKENNIYGLMDKTEKKEPSKKRKHSKQKLTETDDGHKHSKKFIRKESTNIIPDRKDKYNLHDQSHNVDRHDVVKKCKLTDNKGRQSHKHQTGGSDSLKHDLPVPKTKTEEIRSQKKENDKIKAFPVAVKGSPCSKNLEKVWKIKQNAVDKMSNCKNSEENNDSVDKISVNVHSTSPSMIKKKKSQKNSNSSTTYKSSVKKREEKSPQCIKSLKENLESHKENTNSSGEDIVGKTASPKDRTNTLGSKEVHNRDHFKSGRGPAAACTTDMKESTGTVDLDQKWKDSKIRKGTNIVTETKALDVISKLNPANSVAFTERNELSATDSPGLTDRKTVVRDQQVVPDMGTEMLTDSTSCTDLAFSNLPEKRVTNEIADDLVVKPLPDSSCEGERDWGFDSVKLEENCPRRIFNNEDSLDDNDDDMILDLDGSIGGAALSETNNGYPLHDHFRRDSFYEFEYPGDVDFTQD